MIKKTVHKLLVGRHFWRYASFNELIELYVSNMLRAVASNLFSIFIPIFLLQSGYSLRWISIYYMGYFIVRFFGDILSGFLVARIGPKHVWIFSHTTNIINLICLLGLSRYPWLFGMSIVFNALGSSFQYIPVHVDFSKIKHLEHNGKEQGYFFMLEKLGSAIGPLLGGYLAARYSASYTIIASIILYTFSLVPLMASPEPVKTNQKITFRGFPYKKVWRDIASNAARAVDTTITMSMWPMLLALTVFKTTVYEGIGLVTTISLILAIMMTYIFGKIIDNKHTLRFFRISVVLNSIVHLTRLFVGNLLGVIGVNIFNEATSTATSMAYIKGAYDAADDLPGYRIIYFVVLEAGGEILKFLIWFIWFTLTFVSTGVGSLQICFMITAVISLGMMLEKFKALRPGLLARLLG